MGTQNGSKLDLIRPVVDWHLLIEYIDKNVLLWWPRTICSCVHLWCSVKDLDWNAWGSRFKFQVKFFLFFSYWIYYYYIHLSCFPFISWVKLGFYCSGNYWGQLSSVATTSLVPRPSRGGERRPGIHCMCMCNNFHIIYCKSVSIPIPTMCWQVKRSICLKNTGWPDLCTSARAKCVPTLFGGLRKLTWQCLSSCLEISLKCLSQATFLMLKLCFSQRGMSRSTHAIQLINAAAPMVVLSSQPHVHKYEEGSGVRMLCYFLHTETYQCVH